MTGLDPLQVMKRVSDLRNEDAVIDSGDRRQTKSGRPAAVWKLKTKAS
jgi:predicted ArsR family transcriptional regulator